MKPPIIPLLMGISALLAGACQRSDELAPPDVRWDLDVCSECGMILSNPRFAGAVVFRTEDGGPAEQRLFDDVGEMLAWTPPPDAEIRWYVMTEVGDTWMDASAATYRRNVLFQTPMDTGFLAFSTRDEAVNAAPTDGNRIYEFAAARAEAARQPKLNR